MDGGSDASSAAPSIEEHLRTFAHEIVRRGLSMPAIFLFEMYKPLTTLGYASCQMAAPFIIPILGSARTSILLELLKSREHVEILLNLIELEERGHGVNSP